MLGIVQKTRWRELLIAVLALVSVSLACMVFAAQGEISELNYQLSVEFNRAEKNSADLATCRRLLGVYDRDRLSPEQMGDRD